MDGDVANLERLIEIKKKHRCLLYIDEAHATGVLGPQGRGLAADQKDIDVVMGTFSKAMGSFGAYVACSQTMKDYFINHCGGFIYSTALPPPILGAIDAALDLVPYMDAERQKLSTFSTQLRAQLRSLSFDFGPSTSHIVPIITNTEEQTLHFEHKLKENAMIAMAIRPPTVPVNLCRIRIALSCNHKFSELDKLCNTLAQAREK